MSFFSKLFEKSAAERAVEREEVFPFLRRDPARDAAKDAGNEKLFWESAYKEAPSATANLEDGDEAIAIRVKMLLEHASHSASTKPIAFEVISGQLAKMGDSIRASGQERLGRIKQRVELLSGKQFAGISKYYDLMGDDPKASPHQPEPETTLEDKDEALAQKIKRLLLSASFHASRDARAFKHLSGQLQEIGNSIRASGQERWYRLKRRVELLSGEHFVGLAQYYDLLGDAPETSPQHEPEQPRQAPLKEPVDERKIRRRHRRALWRRSLASVIDDNGEEPKVGDVTTPGESRGKYRSSHTTAGGTSSRTGTGRSRAIVRFAIVVLIVVVGIASFYMTGMSAATGGQKLRAFFGSVDARNALAWRYREGRGVPLDFSKAAKWFEKAANSGSAKAQFDLGILYYYGLGVAAQSDTASNWFDRAARQNYGPAVTMLGLIAMEDERNLKKAIALWRQAVSLNDPFAEYLLGTAYLDMASGHRQSQPEETSLTDLREKEHNLVRALFWFEKAKRNGVNPVGGMLQNVWATVPDEAFARVMDKVDLSLEKGIEP